MAKIAVAITILLTIGYVPQETSSQCASSGFKGCECNILGACDIQGNPVPGLDRELTGYAPVGLDQFRYDKFPQSPPNLAYLCEFNTVTILYDCNAKIPLYAATVMDAAQINTNAYKRTGSFGRSDDALLSVQFQQKAIDYKDSSKRELCYESKKQPNLGNYVPEKNWYTKRNPGKTAQGQCSANAANTLKTIIAKGHLIAASYGRGSIPRIEATFTYTNAVPQFGSFNSGQWLQNEKYLIQWGQNNCATKVNQNARMFIVVGVVPSTFANLERRFFGESGFSDYDGWSQHARTYSPNSGKKEYRVNVPSMMWTAACCTFQYVDTQGQLQDGTESVAFFRENDPGNGPCRRTTPQQMIGMFQTLWPAITAPQIFPQNPNC